MITRDTCLKRIQLGLAIDSFQSSLAFPKVTLPTLSQNAIGKKNNMKPGNNIIIVSGSRFRRISEDGKRLLDQTMQEGAIVEYDTKATVLGVIQNVDKGKTAYMVELVHNNVKLSGWVWGYECTPGK